MENADIKKFFSRKRIALLLCSTMLGVLVMFLFSGKKRIELNAIAVSADEKYIACNESYEHLGKGTRSEKILCFCSDGSMVFSYQITPDMSGGGTCRLWFEENTLYVLFVRTDRIIQFTMSGEIVDTDCMLVEEKPKYPSFYQNGRQYVFTGANITVTYEVSGLVDYWFFMGENRLTISNTYGNPHTVWCANIGGVSQGTIMRRP